MAGMMGFMSKTNVRAGAGYFIGTFGCAGRIVKVALVPNPRRKRRPDKVAIEECPACGYAHPHQPVLWREFISKRDDARFGGGDPELILDVPVAEK